MGSSQRNAKRKNSEDTIVLDHNADLAREMVRTAMRQLVKEVLQEELAPMIQDLREVREAEAPIKATRPSVGELYKDVVVVLQDGTKREPAIRRVVSNLYFIVQIAGVSDDKKYLRFDRGGEEVQLRRREFVLRKPRRYNTIRVLHGEWAGHKGIVQATERGGIVVVNLCDAANVPPLFLEESDCGVTVQ